VGRASGPKTRNNGEWTEARYKSFIKSLLRQGTRKWGPITTTKKDARVSRGVYECAGCGEHVPPTVKAGNKRAQNVFVDHIDPIINPETGFISWDETIERMFCEQDNLQLLCKDCHDVKTQKEREVAKQRKK
jgi:5-methylcytosine-specific restriction endonuclease McrA